MCVLPYKFWCLPSSEPKPPLSPMVCCGHLAFVRMMVAEHPPAPPKPLSMHLTLCGHRPEMVTEIIVDVRRQLPKPLADLNLVVQLSSVVQTYVCCLLQNEVCFLRIRIRCILEKNKPAYFYYQQNSSTQHKQETYCWRVELWCFVFKTSNISKRDLAADKKRQVIRTISNSYQPFTAFEPWTWWQ